MSSTNRACCVSSSSSSSSSSSIASTNLLAKSSSSSSSSTRCSFSSYQQQLTAILLMLLVINTNVFVVVDGAQAKGNPHVEIVVRTGRTSSFHPLRSVDNITLWCQAEDHGSTLPIKSAMFIRKKDGKILTATISDDKKRASYDLGNAAVDEAGNYTCKINTSKGSVSGNHQVFVRPVLMLGSADRFDVSDDDAFRFDGFGQSAVIGRSVNLTCPVVAFPQAKHTWAKDGQILRADGEHIRFTNDGTIQLFKLKEEDRGTYECTASNRFVINGHTQNNKIVLSRRLRLKGELAWLWPLLVIIVIVTLLVIIIVFCECRKKRNERKLLEAEAEE